MKKKTIVIKFGGNALNEKTGKLFCKTLAKLPEMGFLPIVVHGGGPQINTMLEALNIESLFINGLRFTDEKTLKVVEMVLSGQVGKMLVHFLSNEGLAAVSISGKDGQTLIAKKLTYHNNGDEVDLGFVGEVCEVSPTLLNTLISNGFIPIIAPIAGGNDGNTYNINADFAAAAIAKALSAKNLIMMTNIEGLLDADKKIIPHATSADIAHLINTKVIQGGMIPKTLSAVETLSQVGEVNIIDGRNPNHLILLLSGKSIGTTIRK